MKKNNSPSNGYDTYAEINLRNLKDNFNIIRKASNLKNKSKNTKICAVVKANAYGHGMTRIAEELIDCGADYLGTAFLTESVDLREYLSLKMKNAKILCLGALTLDTEHFKDVIENAIEVTITDLKSAKALDKYAALQNKIVNVHVKLDTGMNRIGFLAKDAYKAVSELKKLKNLNLVGIYSHYATAEQPGNSYSLKQLKTFKDVVSEIESNIHKFELKHIENSGGILNFRDDFCNMTRPGIMLYGYYTDRTKVKKDIGLKPVMRMVSKVSLVKELPKGESISYGRKYTTTRKTRIASIPIGYGDGYPRALTNKAKVFINKKLYPSVGTVCMDWIMAEVGMKDKINPNDKVIIFGPEYTADDLAKLIDTIPYEIITNVSDRVKRIYV
ncbi:MAG: alanine racemase [Ignavibacteriae bacterium]|nr:alanine racemase [Ignavibacteriota bacterium]MCB0724415.1 alanine racemase [Ignavibacteriota bacterium]MCB9244646.1 alanine racemase [Ignavibacteriales bacterium]